MSWGPTGGYVGGQEPTEKFDREERTPANYRTFKTLARKPRRKFRKGATMNTGSSQTGGMEGAMV